MKNPNKTNPSIRGTHTVRFDVEVPTRLSDSQKAKLKEFESTLSEKNYVKRNGFFQKIKNAFK